jgi:phosphatidylglycerol---prolipoprotein diacylglyceryl transferase
LHPSFGYEIAFHLVAFLLLWIWLRRMDLPPGETFTLYVAGYAGFRFLVEFVRGNAVAWEGLTRPQLVLAVTIPLLLARIAWQVRRGVYARAAARPNDRAASPV